MSQSRILVFVPYFGRLPPWFDLFLLSCEYNPDVDFCLMTDDVPLSTPANVKVLPMTLQECVADLERELGIRTRWTGAYKMCEIRPAFGLVYRRLTKGYTHWGYCDIDVIFGRIRNIYTEEVLRHDLISTHTHIFAAHFALYKCRPETAVYFKAVPGWREMLEDPEYRHFDEFELAKLIYGESHLQLVFAPQVKSEIKVNGQVLSALFREQYSTFVSPQLWRDGTFRMPGHWEWREGVLTAPFLDNAEMLYVHLMHWCSARWTGKAEATWAKLPHIVDPLLGPRPPAFSISEQGFRPLS